MFKYKNVSDFRQSLVVKGKKVLLKPEDVVESDTELKYVFLEPVDISTPTTITGAASVTKKVDALQQTIADLQKSNVSDVQLKEVFDTLEELNDAVSEIRNKLNDFGGVINILKNNIDSISEKQNTITKNSEEDKKVYLKRLEMLKSAVMTLEQEVFTGEEPVK
jgi:uncharacterized coiled-coil DUF342 family protein